MLIGSERNFVKEEDLLKWWATILIADRFELIDLRFQAIEGLLFVSFHKKHFVLSAKNGKDSASSWLLTLHLEVYNLVSVSEVGDFFRQWYLCQTLLIRYFLEEILAMNLTTTRNESSSLFLQEWFDDFWALNVSWYSILRKICTQMNFVFSCLKDVAILILYDFSDLSCL